MSPLIFLQLCRGYCLVLALFYISSMKLNIILGEKNDSWSTFLSGYPISISYRSHGNHLRGNHICRSRIHICCLLLQVV